MRTETAYRRKSKAYIPQYEPVVTKEMRQALLDAFDDLVWIRSSPSWDCHGKRFEEEVAKLMSCNYAVNVNSGTTALFLGLKALGIAQGDEVILAPNTHISPSASIVWTGARPVYVEIDNETLNLDVARVENAITSKTKAIMPVHSHGHAVDMDPLMEIARRHNLYVFEDACQAIGARYKGRRVGTIGHVGAYSYTRNKPMGCGGEGGILVTDDAAIAQKTAMLSDFGKGPDWIAGQTSEEVYCAVQHDVPGLCFRQNEILSAVARVQLRYLDEWNEERRRIADRYADGLRALDTDLTLPTEKPYAWHTWWRYTVRTSKRDALLDHLVRSGIDAGVNYGTPNHLDRYYRTTYGYKVGDFPITEKLAKEVIGLPIYPGLTFDDVDRVVEAVAEFYH